MDNLRRTRQGDYFIPFVLVLCDTIAIGSAFLLSYWLRFYSPLFVTLGFDPVVAPPIGGYMLGSAAMVLIWLLLFQSRRMYRARRRVSLVDELINVSRVGTVGMLVVMSAAFFYRDFSYSRIVFALIWAWAILLIFLGRVAVASFERKLHRRGKLLRNALIAGNGDLATDVYLRLHAHPSFGFRIPGYVADAQAPPGSPLAQTPYLGPLAGGSRIIHQHDIDIVLIALRSNEHDRIVALVTECEGMDVEFLMVPDILEILTSQVRLTAFEGIPFLQVKTNPLTGWGRSVKRLTDIGLSLAFLVLLSPLLALVALLIRLTSRGPILYAQERVGIDGQSFTMLKFRSMKTDAETETGPVWAKEHDPRRTRLGVFLRKTSIDELPQLLNVLRGDMSLVGPRPERPYFVDHFKRLVPKYLDRHRVKTGVTGWAQVNGLRGDTSLEERIKYDLYYIEHWSMAFDIKILLMTIRAALRMREVH